MSTKCKSQLTLAQCISTKKPAIEVERSSQLMSDSEEESSDIEITPRTWESEESGASLPADGSTKCTAVCCSGFSKAYQPTNKKAPQNLCNQQRNFRPEWYETTHG